MPFIIKQIDGETRRLIVGLFETKDEAVAALKEEIAKFEHNGADKEQAYWWIRDGSATFRYIVTTPEP
jgi:hypothetical protein